MKKLIFGCVLALTASCVSLPIPGLGSSGPKRPERQFAKVVEPQTRLTALDNIGIQLNLCKDCEAEVSMYLDTEADEFKFSPKRYIIMEKNSKYQDRPLAAVAVNEETTDGGLQGWISKWSADMVAFHAHAQHEDGDTFWVYYSYYKKKTLDKKIGFYYQTQVADKTITCIMSRSTVHFYDDIKKMCSTIAPLAAQ